MKHNRFLASLMAAIIVLIQPMQAMAISSLDLHSALFDTPFFEANTCSVADTAPVATTAGYIDNPPGGDHQEQAFNFYQMKGLTKEQSAGIVGNLMVESTAALNPTATNGDHWGIVQWDRDRFDALKDYATKTDKDFNDFVLQLNYSYVEAKKRRAISALKDTTSPEDAAVKWEEKIENSGGSALKECKDNARTVFDKFKSNPAPGAETDDKSDDVNAREEVKKVVDKYDLHSVMIQELGGDVVGSYKAGSYPATPASSMKLIIADVMLRSDTPLNKTVSVQHSDYYDGNPDLDNSSYTVDELIVHMLKESSNEAANALMRVMGGPNGFTNKAHAAGYSDTNVKGNYDPSNDGMNKSTVSDQVGAMEHIFSSTDGRYKDAQTALSNGDNYFNVDNIAAVKAGWTDTVASTVGLFKINGNDYIIGLYRNGNSSDSDVKAAIKNGSADLVELVKTLNGGGGSGDTGAGCCPNISAGGDDSTPGEDGSVWNSGLEPPYILEQWAIETLKSIAKKKGVDASNAVTKEHVIALVAFAKGEGGDIQNDSKYNPLNLGSYAEFVAGDSHADGTQAFKSFDMGVEAVSRAMTSKVFSRLGNVLTKKDSTAMQFMRTLRYADRYPGNNFWAEASNPSSDLYRPDYLDYEKNNVKNVRADYKGIAGLVIGTDAYEQAENKTDASKLQFDGGGGSALDDLDGSADCGDSSGDAAAVTTTALKLAWPDGSHGLDPKPEYQEAYQEFNPDGPGMADCGGFVATVMHASGADKNYPPGGTAAQEAYVRSHSDKYDVVDSVDKISDLQPGDILIVNSGGGEGANGHTYIYVGKQPNGFDEASASLDSRMANLGKAELADGRGNYMRARLK